MTLSMRKRMGEVAPDLPIVGVLDQCFLIAFAPGPKNAVLDGGRNDHKDGSAA